jgi:hypothetical protein
VLAVIAVIPLKVIVDEEPVAAGVPGKLADAPVIVVQFVPLYEFDTV